MAIPVATIANILPSVVSAVTQGGPRRQFKWNKRLAQLQDEMNRRNTDEQFRRERALQEEHRRYDSPQAQMQRFIEAGLNPHMIYGGGSGSAGQAFPIHAPQMPGVNVGSVDASYPDVVSPFLAASQVQASTALQAAKTDESVLKQALIKVQTEIAATNPMLSPGVAKNVAEEMEATALLKARQAQFRKAHWFEDHTPDGMARARRVYVAEIEMQIEAMAQRLGLNTSDLAIKNSIFESKEFDNALKEIQMNWLKNGDVTPEHIRQGLMLLLSKMIGMKK